MNRSRFQGVRHVIRFNWPPLTLAVVGALPAAWVLARWLPGPLAIAMALIPVVVPLLATWHAYDRSGVYDLARHPEVASPCTRLANLHAGFDETSEGLRALHPGASLRIFDFYQPDRHTEPSIARARRVFPPIPGTVSVVPERLPAADGAFDRMVVFLAAHEIRDAGERRRVFGEWKRVLDPAGTLVVVEHHRDVFNFLAYSVGAFHFLSRKAWERTFRDAGFSVRSRRLHLLIHLHELRPV